MFRPLLGHLQVLWENIPKSYLYFNALWDSRSLQIVVYMYECEIHVSSFTGTLTGGAHLYKTTNQAFYHPPCVELSQVPQCVIMEMEMCSVIEAV